MLHILLVILKIIGVVLAILAVLLIVSLLAVSFVPLRYRIEGRSEPESDQDGMRNSIFGRVTWLLRLIAVTVEYDNGDLTAILRILWIKRKLYPTPEEEADDEDIDSEEDHDTRITSLPDQEADVTIMSIPEEAKAPVKETTAKPQKKSAAKPEKKFTFLQKLRSIPHKIRNFFQRLKEILADVKRFKNLIYDKIRLIRADETKGVLRRFKDYLLYLWKHSHPRKVEGDLHYGFEDPALTGIVTGVIYLLLPAGCDKVVVNPDFENIVMAGRIRFQGRIRGIHIARIGLKVFRDKEFRNLIKEMKI